MTDDSVQLHLASRWHRLGGFLIDGSLSWGALALAVVVLVWFGDTDGLAVMIGLLVPLWMLMLLITQVALLTSQGQTIGKRVVGIRIVMSDGSNPGFLRAVLLRSAGQVLFGIVPFGRWVDKLLVFTRERRTLHDHLADTWVVGPSNAELPLLSRYARPVGGLGGRLAILGVLGAGFLAAVSLQALVAIPNFVDMQYRAKRAELPPNVDAILEAERAYRAAYGVWLPVSSEAQALAAVPGELAQPWSGGPDWERLGWAPSGAVRGAYWVEVSGDEVAVHAICDVDGDGAYAHYVATDLDRTQLVSELQNY